MVMCICGNFEPESILEEVKKRLKPTKNIGKISRIYEEEPEGINQKYMEKTMSISMPIFMVGIKDKIVDVSEKIKRHMAMDIIMNLLIGNSSRLYKELYDKQILTVDPELEYEFSKQYAHALIGGQSKNPQQVNEMLISEIQKMKNDGINEEDFKRIKRKIYGEFVTEFNDVGSISRMFLSDTIKEVNSFDYVEKFDEVTLEYVTEVFNETFNEENMVLSVIKG